MLKHIRIAFNQVAESILFGMEALRANKTRTLLSTLGITIGIFSIIMVLALVDSLERNVKSSIETLGKDAIIIDKWPWTFTEDYKWWKYINRPNPTPSELKQIENNSQLAEASTLIATLSNVTVKYDVNNATGVNMMAVSQQFNKVKSFNIEQGRYFTESESNTGAGVAIIGFSIAENIFGNLDPIDKNITVRKRRYKVIGVIEKQGESLFGNQFDNALLIPLKNASNFIRINSMHNSTTLQVKAKEGVSVDMLEEELRGIMRSARRLRPGEEEDFALNKTSLFDQPIKATFKVITMAGWVIGGFAMLVGGFGIANIMFVSVKERTNQIGIQKALGAKNYFILIEFLVEAVILCIAGGAIGISAVGLIMLIVNALFDTSLVLGMNNIATGFFTSAIIGVISGFVPAWNASNLDPVEAIRSK